MKKLLLSMTAGVAAIAMAPAANAAQTLTITGPSGTFGDDTVLGGAFTRTFSFLTPAGFNLASATISSVMTGDNNLTNLDFSSVTLNGTQFSTIASGVTEFRNLLNQNIVPGATNNLVVAGNSGGAGSFSGTLSFAAVSAVPEPATWAFMLVGFGAVGYSMRKRPAYKLAQAV